jgi:phosphoserine phosphatase
MVGAFFDVDGTLYRANMWRGLMQYAQEHGRARSARIYGLAHMPLFYLRQLKLLSEEDFRRPWVANLGWMIRGWSEAEGQAAWDWIAEKYLRPTALHDTLARLAEHIAQKHVVVLVSAMLAPCLETLARPLNVTGTVGTATEIRDGKYTGRIPPPVVMGIEKDRMTRAFLKSCGFEVDFAASYAYADSISDRALFEMVGHPVAVYPDPVLKELALTRGWETMGG